MHRETHNAQGQDFLEGNHECACDDSNEKFQGLHVTTKRATHETLHALPNFTPAVLRDRLS